MYQGVRLKSAPFAPFGRSFLPDAVLQKAGFIRNLDLPYERSTATKSTHHEFFKISVESMFGAPSPKIMRVDPLRERLVISETEKGRGEFLLFGEVRSITVNPANKAQVTVVPSVAKRRKLEFYMESPEIAAQFVQRLETLVQSLKLGDK